MVDEVDTTLQDSDVWQPISESELIELASGAVPIEVAGGDPVSMPEFLGSRPGLLPVWYMPAPMARSAGRWRTPVVVALIAAFLVIEAFGLCSTFGQLVPA